MRQPLVLGNWKMNGSQESNRALLQALMQQWQGSAEVGVCPPSLYLSQVQALLASSEIKLGAQDVSAHTAGAFTGEVAAVMLADLGCDYVLVGHSERREYHGESNALVAEKFAAAQAEGLMPVLCVGERLEEREAGNTLTVIAEQLKAVVDRVGVEACARGVIAYEPVWAIGTGQTATPEQAQAVHAFLREQLGVAGEGVRLLYGGSVKADNAQALFAQPDIDGALVGGASLQAEDFLAICAAANARN